MKKYLIILWSLLIIFILTACQSLTSFNGSRTGNESQLIMKYSIFNTTDSQILKLQEDDVLDVDIVSESGSISVVLQNADEKLIYEKENIPTSTFQIQIKESGTYQLIVTGVQAKGSLSFIKNSHK